MYSTTLDPTAEQIIREHGEKDFPNECVGFLYGTEKDDVRHIELARPIINSKEGDQKRRFEVSPIDYMKAEQYALLNDTTLIGVYHSHPQHPAIPSEHDLKQALPFFSYIIVSVLDGKSDKLFSWRLNETGDEFEQEF
ncbi:MAG TPA: M67 family metallopeptidase [Chitinophagales bacterium]|nr:M67 family metallopeptidase [Chitinophagales bacterium]